MTEHGTELATYTFNGEVPDDSAPSSRMKINVVKVVAASEAEAYQTMRDNKYSLRIDTGTDPMLALMPGRYWLESVSHTPVLVPQLYLFVFLLKNCFGVSLGTIATVIAKGLEEAREVLKRRDLTVYESGAAPIDYEFLECRVIVANDCCLYPFAKQSGIVS